jgi:hypothetical protein
VSDESEGLANSWGNFVVALNLTDEWTQYILWSDMFEASAYSALAASDHTFESSKSEVRRLEFMGPQFGSPEADQNQKIQLDDIRFYGVDAGVFGLD